MKLVGVCVLAVAALAGHCQSVSVDEAATRLSFPAGHFLLDLPVAMRGLGVTVSVKSELLGFSDNVGSQATVTCTLKSALTHCLVPMPAAGFPSQSVDDSISLLRLRYTVTGASGATATGILALAHIAPTLYELHVTAPENIHPGGAYTAHIRALQPLTGEPQVGVALTARVTADFDGDVKDQAIARTHLRTNAQGFATVDFITPASKTLSSIDLEIEGTLANLHPRTTQTIDVPGHESADLTTDKPLYQPGQTVHTRLLLLDRNGHARNREKVEFDVRDPDSTLVFRANAVTSSYGIATMDWGVPTSMRLGSYRIQASPEEGGGASASVRLSRYDLPTFTVDPKPDHPFYLPGSNASVDVRANYLFGKPVLHGHVRVVREDERQWNFSQQRYDTKEGAVVEGELDASASFLAHLDLAEDEKDVADDELSNQFHDLHYAAYVTDASTGRTEQRRFDVRVTGQALHVYLTGEDSQVKGLPQRLYLSVTHADGTPAECDVDVSLLPEVSSSPNETNADRIARAESLKHIRTDARGLARLDLPEYEAMLKGVPGIANQSTPDPPELLLRAHDATGQTGGLVQRLQRPDEVLRVSAAKSLYRAGDAIEVAVDSGESSSLPVTVQLLRRTMHGDLLLASLDVTLKAGHASVSFASDANDPRYSGYLFLSAFSLRDLSGTHSRYRYGRSEDEEDPIATASLAVLFPRDNTLHVAVKMSKEQYRPGDEATAALTVRGPQDPDGDITAPATSAVGLVAVDQAVEERNRTDTDFGDGGSEFFFPWRAYFGNSGPVGGVTLAWLQQQEMKKPPAADLQLAAEMMLSTLKVEPEVADTAPSMDMANTFAAIFRSQLDGIRKALGTHIARDYEVPTTAPALTALLAGDGIAFNDLRDPWGEPYAVVSTANSYGQSSLALRSRGPDKLPGTADDFSVPLVNWSWFRPIERDLTQLVDRYHERTGGFIRDLPQLKDEAAHEGMDVTAWRDPWNQAFDFSFEVAQSDYVVGALTRGDPAAPPNLWNNQRLGAFARTNYFNGERARIETILNQSALSHPYPTNDAELAAAGVDLTTIRDPWDHPLYATFQKRSFHTDRVTVEAHATQGATPQNRTTITPVTEIADNVTLHSAGPDGAMNSGDDFVLAAFTHVRSQQSANDATATRPANQTVRSTSTGALKGTVTDVSGAVIPGAIVIAKDGRTGDETQVKSDRNGTYLIDPIPADEYDVRFSAPGFMDLVYSQVKVLSPDATVLDAKLNIGSVTETIAVVADSPAMETSNASGTVITNQSIVALPLPMQDKKAMATPRLRDYFPETLLWRPEIVTSPDGSATARFKVADSITTWKISAAASTREGNTGAGAAQFRSFQPFFAAFDPPRILTIGDRVTLPVTLRNYLDHALTVTSELKPAPWLRIEGAASQTTHVPAQDSASPVLSFTATGMAIDAPQQFLTRGADAGDNIAKPVTVHPDGLPTWVSTAGVLKAGDTTLTLVVPADAIPGGSDARLRLYPNLAAHIRDSLVQMAAYPGGCAEQITSIAWPSLLLQRYAAALPRPDKKLQQKTHGYLEEAYENLLADQRGDGGFGYWYNDRHSDAALTAYVVQFLTQAKEFIAVDDNVLKNAVAYLAKEQQQDGHWLALDRSLKPLPNDKIGDAMLTASIAAMIADAPAAQPLVSKALAATQPFVAEYDEPYTLASYALAAIAMKDQARGDAAIQRLRSMALTENGGAYWKLETNTPFFGWGRAGRVEASAQTLRALLAAGATPQDDLVARGLLFLDHEQDRDSLWYSTQATARVLDVLSAIALSDKAPTPRSATGSLVVAIDGHAVAKTALPSTNADAGPIYVPLGAALNGGEHRITLTLPPSAGAATAQIVDNIYRPWPASAPLSATTNNEQLRMTTTFNNTAPVIGAAVEASAHIERIGFRGYGMFIAEIGLPPGADVDRASLESAMTASDYQVNHYEVLPDRVLLYVWPKAGELDVKFRFSLRYGIDALTAPSTVYDYYNPDSHFDLAPIRFAVH